ncbi:MAG: SDR family NAD(P)-dependent oxidoreductase [Bacteroidetes bacterium]|nr:SDR family NAD(P)-dependent oxidoreductase [Bacteroidota bacterium]
MEENKQEKYKDPFRATLTGILDLFKKQVPVGTFNDSDRLDGKTVVVDGASSGLGFAIAVEVASKGAKTVMVCRSGIPAKGEEVRKLSGNQDVHMLHVDFADVRSLEKLVSELRDKYTPIDILICNAGVVPNMARKTPQGLEEMFMVNYFSKFWYVTTLIENGSFGNLTLAGRESVTADSGTGPGLPLDVCGAANSPEISVIPRIIFVSSESHRNPAVIKWDDFGKFTPYGIKQSMEHYGHNKLLLTTFAVELSRRLNPNGSTAASVFALCPGPVNSNIARESPKVFQPLLKVIFRMFFKSPKDASAPVIYFSVSHDVEAKPFDYLFLMNRKEVDSKALDPENGLKLWEMSSALKKNL